MTIRYRADLLDTAGSVVAIFSDFISLKYTIEASNKGNYQLVISGFDDRRLLFDDDYLVKIYMDDRSEGISWYNVFTGIHKTFTNALFENGRRVYTSFGPSEEEIVDKARILYKSGAPVDKTGVSSTIMYEYVLENVGASATVANGRIIDGTNPITNAPDTAAGPTWSGSKQYRGLMEVLIEIHQNSVNQGDQVDFRVTHTTGYNFQFEAGALGVDRTVSGLTPTSNGLNGAGNVPVIFGPSYKNVMNFVKSNSRFNEFNTVIAIGQGSAANRATQTAQDGILATRSPIAQRETVANGNTIPLADTAALLDVAQARLDEKKSQEKFNFTPQRGSQILFRDYFPGDFITGEDFDGNQANKQVRRVDVSVSATKNALIERQRIKFADV